MQTISKIDNYLYWRNNIVETIGFVPTMGAIHKGHLSLIEKSIEMCKYTIVSIYLNPAQFSRNEDLDTYPQNLELDVKILSEYNIDILFAPQHNEMYPDGLNTILIEKKLSNVLEGKSRPSFFVGVTTIVSKLFNIVRPTHAFFGEKDAQQILIIKKIVQDMSYPIKIIACPIIRESNGLAISSRNQYFSIHEKKIASIINIALQNAKNLILAGEINSNSIKDKISNILKKESSIIIDYISIADSKTLIEYTNNISGTILVSVAVFLNKIRLIDNFILEIK